MAVSDPQRQLLTLILEFATEKSQGERRVIGLEKLMQELGCEVDVANGEMEEVKCIKETTEQELKGYELQLALNEASIQTLEARISIIQDEISSVGSQVEGLKVYSPDVDLNAKIRKFQEEKCIKSKKKSSIGTTAEPDRKAVKKVVTEVELRALEDILAHVASQTSKEEQEYIAEENIQNQVQKEYIDLQRKVSLMEAIVKETKALQDLTRQASVLEQNYASLGEQLQKRCLCPLCHADNFEVPGGVLQANEAN
ncbi:PREDICTED: uncharacterized protein LOC105114252 [Populus euphratica]|uniref:Uncharacterized protein LOC105114252 n=1 Tax=Populus euphratica TaxID=75702 RepID=A0AAJ6TDC8_POPEU|nr:PREDICTED: uncharacterized protein LOC105114252 [Populus euphratica]